MYHLGARLRNIYLVGSVPLDSTTQVFETIASKFRERIKRIPDGEVGSRANWGHFESLFSGSPAFEHSGQYFQVHEHAPKRAWYRLQHGKSYDQVRFDDLGFAETAMKSYAIFADLKSRGAIPLGTRFQVSLLPAHSVLLLFSIDHEQRLLEPVFNRAVLRELAVILDHIPHGDLAIQFDVASAVFARIERGEPSNYGQTRQQMTDEFTSIMAELASHVPPNVHLLFHFCYGDANHRHVVEPTDVGVMVEFANRLCKKLPRGVDLIHMPVPRSRCDDGYFAPLVDLADTDFELALGLVHYTDGIEGTRRRMDAASRRSPVYAVAAECGFGRRPPETIRTLLDVHVAAAEYG